MQITLVSSGDTVSDVLDRFNAKFLPEWTEAEIEKKFNRLMVTVSESLITYSIRNLKAMTDFLATALSVTGIDAPKRNSKVSLAGWIAGILLSAREVAEASGAIADQAVDSSSREVEVLQPEEKPVYKISIHPDRNVNNNGRGFSEERVSALPPYLLDRQGNLFERSSYTIPSCDATYAQLTSQHLSSIAEKHGQAIELTTDDLVSAKAHVHGSPPPFIVNDGGVYKRMTWGVISWGKVVKYAQVISEYLSNIVVV